MAKELNVTSKELIDFINRRQDKYGLESLYSELLNVDKEAAENLDRFNARRVVRALEVYYNTGKKFSELKKQNSCFGKRILSRTNAASPNRTLSLSGESGS